MTDELNNIDMQRIGRAWRTPPSEQLIIAALVKRLGGEVVLTLGDIKEARQTTLSRDPDTGAGMTFRTHPGT